MTNLFVSQCGKRINNETENDVQTDSCDDDEEAEVKDDANANFPECVNMHGNNLQNTEKSRGAKKYT